VNVSDETKGTTTMKQATKTKTKATSGAGERAVLVTTSHRGVFFGYATQTDGEIVKLRAARNCLYWSADVKGFVGLAATGPTSTCRVGPAADMELRDITAVLACSPEAELAWSAAPWA
jgi:hypothetical protein